ncbi:MAG: hypothetical protein ACJAXJ_001214 [Colwellia sp.]|jgi:hypothetical protein
MKNLRTLLWKIRSKNLIIKLTLARTLLVSGKRSIGSNLFELSCDIYKFLPKCARNYKYSRDRNVLLRDHFGYWPNRIYFRWAKGNHYAKYYTV